MSSSGTTAVARAVRRLRATVRTPADLWLLCRMAPWAVALPLLKHALRLETLTRLAWAEPRRRTVADVDKVVALSGLLTRRRARSRGACYERSLLSFRFLSQARANPTLVVAVRRAGGAVDVHSWVTVDGAAVGEPAAIEEFAPVVSYGRGGRRRAVDVAPP
jgi:Transglutaminase-like superfamily